MRDPFDQMKRIRFRPDGKAGGLRVQWIQNDSLLRRLGVRTGDVIKSVNGIPLMRIEDIASALNFLTDSQSLDVEVIRGGQDKAIHFVVK